ncbi:Ger(x)C family spore germination protein [Lederbergia lenta]|uniref:Ger(x)C family spore germination protein n=1 Tax=Lederbergia lenta TaxID=1467 RepID=UPI0020422864|nr:Ger(x)C family spore germination protein [Lederbergia lenta]MCM3112579.1 Ger(x)C family spore germination protein [Lederbergia lenta]
MSLYCRKGKAVFLVFILLLSFLLQTGCAFKDIDKRLFVMGIGVDYTENEKKPYRITLKIALPTGSLKEASNAEYTYLVKDSNTLAGAIRIMRTHVDKELDFGHARVILFGEKMLGQDLKDVMDFFLRRSDIQLISWVAVGRPTAEKVLKTEPTSEMAASNALFNLFADNSVESAFIVTTFLFDFRRRVLEYGIDPILPILQTNEKDKVSVNKSIVLISEKRSLELSSRQTKFYNLLANKLEELDLEVKKDDLTLLINIDNTKVKYKIITPDNQNPVLKMDIEMGGVIEESNKTLSSDKLELYNKYANEVSKKRIISLLTLFQEKEVDPLGFGLRYKASRLHTKDTYAEWQKIYPDLVFEINVKTTIKSTGTIK